MATFYEIILHLRYSGEPTWQIFLMDYFDTAITLDVYGLLPALNEYAESPEEISAKFDYYTYNKAAIIIGMINWHIGIPIWTQGVSNYIVNQQMGSASPQDLYSAVQQAVDEANPFNNLNFTLLMSPWFDLTGFPVLTVSRSDEGLSLRQEGFKTIHNEVFPIPINFASATVPDFGNITAGFWMITGELTIYRQNSYRQFTDDDWIILNLR